MTSGAGLANGDGAFPSVVVAAKIEEREPTCDEFEDYFPTDAFENPPKFSTSFRRPKHGSGSSGGGNKKGWSRWKGMASRLFSGTHHHMEDHVLTPSTIFNGTEYKNTTREAFDFSPILIPHVDDDGIGGDDVDYFYLDKEIPWATPWDSSYPPDLTSWASPIPTAADEARPKLASGPVVSLRPNDLPRSQLIPPPHPRPTQNPGNDLLTSTAGPRIPSGSKNLRKQVNESLAMSARRKPRNQPKKPYPSPLPIMLEEDEEGEDEEEMATSTTSTESRTSTKKKKYRKEANDELDARLQVILALKNAVIRQRKLVTSYKTKVRSYKSKLSTAQAEVTDLQRKNVHLSNMIIKLESEREAYAAETESLKKDLLILQRLLTTIKKDGTLTSTTSSSSLDGTAATFGTESVNSCRSRSFYLRRSNSDPGGCKSSSSTNSIISGCSTSTTKHEQRQQQQRQKQQQQQQQQQKQQQTKEHLYHGRRIMPRLLRDSIIPNDSKVDARDEEDSVFLTQDDFESLDSEIEQAKADLQLSSERYLAIGKSYLAAEETNKTYT